MDANELYRIFEARRRELNLSQKQVGEAIGSSSSAALQNIRRGASPSISRVSEICKALGLEMYIGPQRDIGPPDSLRPYAGDVRIGGSEYSLVSRYQINVSAGPGLIPFSEDKNGSIAFSRAWLLRHGINAQLAGIVQVRGRSMEPTIQDQSWVLVHMAEMNLEREGIYAFSRGGQASIKRLVPVDRSDDGRPRTVVIISDNPEHPPEIVSGSDLNEIRVVGRVRWLCADI